MISRTAPKHFDSLTSLRKRSSESLREYAARFVDLYNEVEDCTEKQVVSVFRLGLSFGEKLRESLTLSPVETFPEPMERVEQHAKLEDESKREASRTSNKPHRANVVEKEEQKGKRKREA